MRTIEIRNKIKKSFPVVGMTCASCALSLETHLGSKNGVEFISVNYPNKSVLIEYDSDLLEESDIKSFAQEIGYDISIKDEERLHESVQINEEKRLLKLRKKVLVSIMFSLPVFILSMFLMNKIPFQNWILLGFSIPVVFWSGSEFFINAWKRLKHFSSSMDTLVALSTGTAFIFSLLNTVYPQFLIGYGIPAYVYYESAVVIISLILLGRYIEEKAKSNTSQAIKDLIALQPKKVIAIRNGEQVEISLEEVIVGELIVIRPGDSIPVDGSVKKGESFVDESSITGEYFPRKKKKRDKVYAGTINQKGSFTILAEHIGKETVLSNIVESVKEAQNSKPPIQKLVDSISKVFVPTVLVIALLAFLIWFFIGPFPQLHYAMLALVSTLIIACPCALGLATPTALMVGIGEAAKKGILIKDANALEQVYKASDLVIDKTGTLTKGTPLVEDFIWVDQNENKEFCLGVLLAAEKKSEHPLAQSIVESLRTKEIEDLELDQFNYHRGLGLEVSFQSEKFYIGNERLLTLKGIEITTLGQEKINQLKNEIKSVVLLATSSHLKLIVGITDQIKEGAKEAIENLKSLGVKITMLTGDNYNTALHVSRKLGINDFQSDLLPSQKVDFIKKLQQENKMVIMAGDGVNDSAGIAQADVGIAMATGSDIAMNSAGITLMFSDIRQISKAIQISKNTVQTIRQNLFWAFIYNVLAIPLAAGVMFPINGYLITPMLAGGAMSLSSISVVLNSLRLKQKIN